MKFVLAGYGGRGDVEPLAAVGNELSRRGHQVQLAVPPNLLDFVESAGLAAVGYGPDVRGQLDAATAFVGGGQNAIDGMYKIVERVTREWTQKSATLRSLAKDADLLVAHMNDQVLAANVAEYLAIPLAALHVFPARLMPSGWLYSGVTKGAEDEQREALGLPETADSATRQLVDAGLLELQTYDELCLPGSPADWVAPDDRRPFVGVLTLQSPTDADDEVLAWIAAGTPPIYFGFGSTPIAAASELVAVIGATCAQLGERALISSGTSDFSDSPALDHVKVVGALNFATVFPACRAVVHHGGAGTTAAGLRAGLPTLILWGAWDQPVWAAGVEQLGVGSGQEFSTITQGSLVAGLRSILTPECAARAGALATRLTTPGQSIARATDLLEESARAGLRSPQ